jgi:hypothetical protein
MAQRPVLSVREVRTGLSDILRRFNDEGEQAEPVLLGSQRVPEAVMIPYVLWERLEADADDPELLADLDTEHGEPLPRTEATS